VNKIVDTILVTKVKRSFQISVFALSSPKNPTTKTRQPNNNNNNNNKNKSATPQQQQQQQKQSNGRSHEV
jgi:hypothetical protein